MLCFDAIYLGLQGLDRPYLSCAGRKNGFDSAVITSKGSFSKRLSRLRIAVQPLDISLCCGLQSKPSRRVECRGYFFFATAVQEILLVLCRTAAGASVVTQPSVQVWLAGYCLSSKAWPKHLACAKWRMMREKQRLGQRSSSFELAFTSFRVICGKVARVVVGWASKDVDFQAYHDVFDGLLTRSVFALCFLLCGGGNLHSVVCSA